MNPITASGQTDTTRASSPNPEPSVRREEWRPTGEQVRITREDTREERKIVTTIRVVKDGVSVVYQRVSHDWGGVYYFRNGTTCISEILFMEWTGMRF